MLKRSKTHSVFLRLIHYWIAVPIAPQDRPLTGFVTSQGHFQWRYMAFVLRNVPATFSRLLTKVFKGLEEFCEPHLDDLMVFSNTWQNHIAHLNQVFDRIRLANLTLNLNKFEFANAQLHFLGHSLSINIEQCTTTTSKSRCAVEISTPNK